MPFYKTHSVLERGDNLVETFRIFAVGKLVFVHFKGNERTALQIQAVFDESNGRMIVDVAQRHDDGTKGHHSEEQNQNYGNN